MLSKKKKKKRIFRAYLIMYGGITTPSSTVFNCASTAYRANKIIVARIDDQMIIKF